jgi:hypothetical protein
LICGGLLFTAGRPRCGQRPPPFTSFPLFLYSCPVLQRDLEESSEASKKHGTQASSQKAAQGHTRALNATDPLLSANRHLTKHTSKASPAPYHLHDESIAYSARASCQKRRADPLDLHVTVASTRGERIRGRYSTSRVLTDCYHAARHSLLPGSRREPSHTQPA